MIMHTECPHFYYYAEPGMSERARIFPASGWRARKDDPVRGTDTVAAAFIAEPIIDAGSVIVPPEGYFEEIQAVLRKYDILMMPMK